MSTRAHEWWEARLREAVAIAYQRGLKDGAKAEDDRWRQVLKVPR